MRYGTGLYAMHYYSGEEGSRNMENVIHSAYREYNRFPRHLRGISAEQLEMRKVVENWGSALECR